MKPRYALLAFGFVFSALGSVASAQPAPSAVIEIDKDNPPPGIAPATRTDARVPSAEDYPVASVAAQEQGITELRYMVLMNGSIGTIEISASSGKPRLDEAAIALARRWQFRPAMRNGMPIAVWQRSTVVFQLR